MSNSFPGFSEDDIKRLNTKLVLKEENPLKRVIKAKRRISNSSKAINSVIKVELMNDLSESAKFSSSSKNVLASTLLQPVDEPTPTLNIIPGAQKIDLDEFAAKQKRIEEQNRCRKELLAKALAHRTNETELESRRLKEIQNEFKKLDALLSNDVSILRHQIELASLDFMEAQKRYHKIEKEFLDAKVILHQKLDKKNMLTEHLCTIIEKNEERKADKLNELMNRLTSGDFPDSLNCNLENATIKIENVSIPDINGTQIVQNSDMHANK